MGRFFIRLFLPTVALVLFAFQNCAPAKFSSSGILADKGQGGLDTPGGSSSSSSSGAGTSSSSSSSGATNGSSSGASSGGASSGGANPPPELPEICGENEVVNGSFEITDERKGQVNSLLLNALAEGNQWDVYDSLPDGAGGVSWFKEDGGAGVEVRASTDVRAAHGMNYVAFGRQPKSGIYQQLRLTEAGDYILRFRYRAMTNQNSKNKLQVLFDNVEVETRGNSDQRSWQKVKVRLKALSAGQHILSFRGAGKENGLGALIDAVRLERFCRRGEHDRRPPRCEREDREEGRHHGFDRLPLLGANNLGRAFSKTGESSADRDDDEGRDGDKHDSREGHDDRDCHEDFDRHHHHGEGHDHEGHHD